MSSNDSNGATSMVVIYKLKSWINTTPEEWGRLVDKQRALSVALAGMPKHDMFTDLHLHWDDVTVDGHGAYIFEGTYSQALVDKLGHKPDHEEIVWLVHGSAYHHGAYCTLYGDRVRGLVYT